MSHDELLDSSTDALAVYRLVKLVREDKIMERPREWWWSRHDPESTQLGYLLSCPWCLSIYAAAALSVSRIVFPRFTRLLSRTLALSAVTGIMTEREESRQADGF